MPYKIIYPKLPRIHSFNIKCNKILKKLREPAQMTLSLVNSDSFFRVQFQIVKIVHGYTKVYSFSQNVFFLTITVS